MQINILGDGSAGKRHMRMLSERGHQCKLIGPIETPELFLDPNPTYPECDAVVIASPPEIHECNLRLYWNRVPILCEGPVTWCGFSPTLPNMTAANWLFVPHVRSLMKRARSDVLPRPIYAHLHFDYDLAKWRPDVEYRQTCYYASGIDNINCHEAATALALFGSAERVSVERGRSGKSRGVDTVALLIRHTSGVLTTITSSWHSAVYRRGIRVAYVDGSSDELGWTSPASDDICNVSYGAMLDQWLSAVEHGDMNVRPSLEDGYRAYKLVQGEVV